VSAAEAAAVSVQIMPIVWINVTDGRSPRCNHMTGLDQERVDWLHEQLAQMVEWDKDAPTALAAIHAARAVARQRAWRLAGKAAPDAGIDAAAPLVIDLDATLVTSHSDKEGSASTFNR
jgi:hypothetical protein